MGSLSADADQQGCRGSGIAARFRCAIPLPRHGRGQRPRSARALAERDFLSVRDRGRDAVFVLVDSRSNYVAPLC